MHHPDMAMGSGAADVATPGSGCVEVPVSAKGTATNACSHFVQNRDSSRVFDAPHMRDTVSLPSERAGIGSR